MTAAAIKTGNGSVFRLADGNNGLVAIALHSLRAYYALRAQFQSANALERVIHTFEFISQLRLICRKLHPPQRPKLGQAGSTRSGDAESSSSPLPYTAVFVTFTILIRQRSPGIARGTNTARPHILHTPAPSEVRPVTSASYILFFLSSSITILYHAAGRASIYIKKFAISSALCYHNELITRQAALGGLI